MLHRKDNLDDLIFQALFKNSENIPDKVLDILYRNEPNTEMPRDVSQKMMEKLRTFAKNNLAMKKNLSNPLSLNHLGEYISIFMQIFQFNENQISKSADVSTDIINGLKKNNLSIISIDVEKMASILKCLRLKWEIAKYLIYKSYKLQILKPKLPKTLARYDSRKKDVADKDKSMLSAVQELLLKSELPKEKEIEIQDYLKNLNKAYEET